MGCCVEELYFGYKTRQRRRSSSSCYSIGCNREKANKVFRTFTFSSPDEAKKIEPVEEYCIPRENTIYERFLFFTRDQRESETIDQYLAGLRQVVANCDFASITPDQLLRDRLVTGTRNAKVRENLLKEKKLTLEKAVDIARAAKSTAAQIKVMS